MKLTNEERIRMVGINDRVIAWAREYASNDLYYGTPYSYYRTAKEIGMISDDEYELAQRSYGQLWHYRGD